MKSNGEEKLVSVIIPTYNRKELLLKAVDYVLNQTYKEIEIIVVDNSEKDCLVELNSLMKKGSGGMLVYIHNDEPMNASASRNIGLEVSSGNYIAFLDDDDEWHPEKIEKQVELMVKHPDCPLVTCGSLDLRYGRRYEDYPPVCATRKELFNSFSYSCTSAYLFRRTPLFLFGGFDEDLPSAQEYELALRLTPYHKPRSVPKLLVTQNASDGQISTNWKNKRKGITKVFQKYRWGFLLADWKNGFKIVGLRLMFHLCELIGEKRVYGLLHRFKKKHASGKKRILFLYKQDRSFVHMDYELLAKNYDVIKYRYTGLGSLPGLINNFRKVDIIFSWFASYHSFFPAFLSKKPLVVVTGGYDVACEKEIGYGLMLSPIWRRMVRYILKSASAIISVSEFNRSEVKRGCGLDSIMIYNCVDSDKFKPAGKEDKNLVLTVGAVTLENWVRKGISNFVDVAELFNDGTKFYAVGRINADAVNLVKNAVRRSDNIDFTGFVSDDELLKLYQKAKVYCQLSYYESFGVSPAEAMLCGCIPIVTDRSALPEVVGELGYKKHYHDTEGIVASIKEAQKKKSSKVFRDRIVKTFSLEKREKQLCKVMEDVINENK